MLVHLDELSMSNTQLTGAGLAHLAYLGSVKTLGVTGCKKFGDAGVKHIVGWSSLQLLSAGGTAITDAGLADLGEAGLIDLEYLDLKGYP